MKQWYEDDRKEYDLKPIGKCKLYKEVSKEVNKLEKK